MRISYYNDDEEPAVKRFAENQTGVWVIWFMCHYQPSLLMFTPMRENVRHCALEKERRRNTNIIIEISILYAKTKVIIVENNRV